MVKEIKYTGFTASPSDYECPDGDLAAVLNVVPEEGSLSPVLPPRQLFQLSDGGDVRFVHETSYIRNFIILHPDNSITWRTEKDPDRYSHGTLSHSFSGHTIHQINAIGNTLIVLADDGMHYFLWKGYRNGSEQQGDEPKEYLYLGTHMPELSLSFGLQGSVCSYHTNDYTISGINREIVSTGADAFFSNQDEDGLKMLNQHIFAGINSMIEQESQLGKFIFPFFIRYAYRLYDGSLIMHSAPILMVPSTGIPVKSMYKDVEYYHEDRKAIIEGTMAIGISHDIDYMAISSEINKLEDWSDIIKSVDIFVSRQIFTMREFPESTNRIDTTYALYNKNGGYGWFSSIDPDGSMGNYMRHSIDEILKVQYNTELIDEDEEPIYRYYTAFNLLHRNENDLISEIESCNNFYFMKSIAISELATERTKIVVRSGIPGTYEKELEDPDNNISNIVTHELMTDDYESHDLLLPRYSFNYNARLNITDISKYLFDGYQTAAQFPYTNASTTGNISIYYLIKQDNKNIVVHNQKSVLAVDGPLIYIYYPNVHAYKAIVKCTSSDGLINYCREVPLIPHPTLNGAYFFDSLEYSLKDDTDKASSVPNISIDKRVELRNKIYTSEVNDPFHFPSIGINTVGTGRIFAMSTAAKALSQGQFGQFPLYAFTTEGVWALTIKTDSDTSLDAAPGLYKAVQPITRDVCINPDSITQLDSSVLFATDRGIMLLSGSNSMCISDNLNYDQVFHIDTLPSSDKLISLAGLSQENFSYVAFREFLIGCSMLYDYVHQRIIVYSRHTDASGHPVSPYPYAYVYSLKTKTWGMIHSNIKDTVPSYPEALAMLFDGSLADYSAEGTLTTDADGNLTGIKGVLITRPLKLDAPDVLKTVDTVIQRGNFQRGHIKTAIYGSRDLIHWFVVWTSVDHYLRGFRGTPYKYFRLVLLCDLDPTESIYGCTIQYTPRFTNRLR